MQDQVYKLSNIGKKSVFLGSACLDKQAERNAMNPEVMNAQYSSLLNGSVRAPNQASLHNLVRSKNLALIAVDEAHLISEWNDFKTAFSELKKLKSDFNTIPIMALSATATAVLEEHMKLLLRNPFISKC